MRTAIGVGVEDKERKWLTESEKVTRGHCNCMVVFKSIPKGIPT